MGRVVCYYELPGPIQSIAPCTRARGPIFDFIFLLEAALDGDGERAVVHLFVALERVKEPHEFLSRVSMGDNEDKFSAILSASELLND